MHWKAVVCADATGAGSAASARMGRIAAANEVFMLPSLRALILLMRPEMLSPGMRGVNRSADKSQTQRTQGGL